MTMRPIDKIVYQVTREMLASKEKNLSAILDAVAAELAPIVAARLKVYFARLLSDSEDQQAEQMLRQVMMQAAINLREVAGKSDVGVWPTLRRIAEDLQGAAQGVNHG